MLFGPDLSHYQAGIDLKRVASEGHSFVLGKVSQGAGSRDAQWTKTRDGARAVGLILLGYHYVTTENADKQAANCAGWLGDKSIPLALDWEASSGNWANFMNVLNAFRRAGLNVRLAYCPRWYWQSQGSPNMAAAGIPLWSSRYPSTSTGSPAGLYTHVASSLWAGYGGLSVGLLQFSDRAAIAGMATDCSAFQGTREELLAMLGSNTDTAPPPVGDELSAQFETDERARWPRADQLDRDIRADLHVKQLEIDDIKAMVSQILALLTAKKA